MPTIKQWNSGERPRERMLQSGASSLSNAELLAILLRSGNGPQCNVLDLSRVVLAASGGSLGGLCAMGPDALMKIEGMGEAKVCSLLAAFELGRRVACESLKSVPVTSSAEAVALMRPLLSNLNHEECWVLYLDRGNKLISREKVSSGGVSSTVMDPRIIMRKAVEKLASGIIVFHNHPSGNPRPGKTDNISTESLRKAAVLLEISLLDHIIIGADSYYSFCDGISSPYPGRNGVD